FTHPHGSERIKVHHSIKDGARHLWHFISSSRYLTKKYRDIIEPVISRTAHFAAPENMLLAMLTERDDILELLELGELSRQGKLAHTQIAKKACLKGFGNLVVGMGKGLSQRFP
ncbi:hypothetical protein AVEN_261185-1, partial [Araneus ventricosus]